MGRLFKASSERLEKSWIKPTNPGISCLQGEGRNDRLQVLYWLHYIGSKRENHSLKEGWLYSSHLANLAKK